MKTRFDNISDERLSDLLFPIGMTYQNFDAAEYESLRTASDEDRIAFLVLAMDCWKSWLGPPVTFYSADPLHFDGHRRVRALKFLADWSGLQISFPVRFDHTRDHHSEAT